MHFGRGESYLSRGFASSLGVANQCHPSRIISLSFADSVCTSFREPYNLIALFAATTLCVTVISFSNLLELSNYPGDRLAYELIYAYCTCLVLMLLLLSNFNGMMPWPCPSACHLRLTYVC